MQRRRILLVALLPFSTLACAAQRPSDDDDGSNGRTTEITFGTDSGQLSTNAAELLAKPGGNPDPRTLVGIYEGTGYGYEDNPAEYVTLSNDWRLRREHRESGIAMAVECLIDVGGAFEETRTIQAFVSSPIELFDWGVRILEQQRDDQAYTNFGFDVHCAVELAPLDTPFCVQSGVVPEGYSTCVTIRDGHLTFLEENDVLDAGKKISN